MGFQKKLFKKINGLQKILSREASLRERLQHIAHLLTGNVLSSVIGLAGFALTARALGPEGYGILALCFSYTRAIERLVSFQSWQPLIKYGADAQARGAEGTAELQSLLKFGLLLDVSAAVAGWLIAVLLVLIAAPWLGISKEMSGLVILYTTILPFHISGMATAVLRLYGRFMAIAYGQVVSSVVRVVLCAVGVVVGADLFGFALIWMSAQLIGALALLFLSLFELRRQGLLAGLPRASLSGITLQFPGLWKFAISANISLTIRSSANEVDTLLVGYLADPTSAGLYHIAKRIGRIAQQAGVQVQAVLYPELARAWAARALGAFHQAVNQMQGLLLAFGLVLVGGLYLLIGPLLNLAVGPDFAAAGPLVIVQSIAVTMTLCGAVIRSALLAMGRENEILWSVLISTVAFHATALTLIPAIGAMGANIAHIVMASIWLSTMMVSYRRKPSLVT
jgi:O-antigen/teichoic acid export membrane protein